MKKTIYLLIAIIQTCCSRVPVIKPEPGSAIKLAVPASRRNLIPGSGYLIVTDKNIIFEPNTGLTPIRKVVIDRSEIERIKKKQTIFGFPWIVIIKTKTGESYRFAISNTDQLINSISTVSE